MQHATSELLRWLRDGYNLDMHSIGILLGQAVQYDMSNMFDPAYTMVCKLPKALLARLVADKKSRQRRG